MSGCSGLRCPTKCMLGPSWLWRLLRHRRFGLAGVNAEPNEARGYDPGFMAIETSPRACPCTRSGLPCRSPRSAPLRNGSSMYRAWPGPQEPAPSAFSGKILNPLAGIDAESHCLRSAFGPHPFFPFDAHSPNAMLRCRTDHLINGGTAAKCASERPARAVEVASGKPVRFIPVGYRIFIARFSLTA